MEILSYFIKTHKEKLILASLAILQLLLFLPLIKEVHTSSHHLKELSRQINLQNNMPDTGLTAEMNSSKNILEDLWLDEEDNLKFSNWYKEGRKDLFIRPRSTSVKNIQKDTAPKVNLSYVGLFRTEKETIAMVKDLTTGKNHFKKEGEQITGYKIMDIKKDILILSDPSGGLIQLPKGGINNK